MEEIVPDVGAEVWQSAKAMGFAFVALEFEHAGEIVKDCRCSTSERYEGAKPVIGL